MKLNKSTILAFILLIITGSLYRVWDGRPWGFAPQIAMALFAGSVIKDKKIAFLLPLLSMFVSDMIYHILNQQGLTEITGFYKGQWVNYALFILITVIGFYIKKNNIGYIILGSLAGAIFFFLASNFFDWAGGAPDINNQPYPKTWDGLTRCMAAGIPFLKGSLLATFFFNAVYFGCHYFYNRFVVKVKVQTQSV